MAKAIRLSRAQWREKQRQALIEHERPAVERIARQVHEHMSHVPVEDLIQDGYVGLMQAVERYTPAKGQFSAYAYFRIRGAMIDAHKRSAYRNETHESIDAIQERIGFLPKELNMDRNHLPADEIAARRERRRLLLQAVGGLQPDERRVFLAFVRGTTMAAVAEEYGRTPAWARQKLAAARAQLGAAVAMWGMGLDKAA